MKIAGHLATGAASAVVIDTTLKHLSHLSFAAFNNPLAGYDEPSFLPERIGTTGTALLMTFYVLGLLIPDCDNEDSIISRIIYLPLGHRTWTHTVWAVLLFFIPGLFYKPLLGLAAGIFVHIFFDSFSKSGVCWLYPLTKYNDSFKWKHTPRRYTTGLEQTDVELLDNDSPPPGWQNTLETHHTKPGHKLVLYRNDRPGSVVLVTVIWCVVAGIYYGISMQLWK